jgi:hypothetical protein
MRYLIAVFGVVAVAICAGTPAQAQNYPWCEYLGGGEGGGGGRNCGFTSYDQCMQSAWGNGGDCRQNTQYQPPAGSHHDQTGAAPPHRTRHAKKLPPKNS